MFVSGNRFPDFYGHKNQPHGPGQGRWTRAILLVLENASYPSVGLHKQKSSPAKPADYAGWHVKSYRCSLSADWIVSSVPCWRDLPAFFSSWRFTICECSVHSFGIRKQNWRQWPISFEETEKDRYFGWATKDLNLRTCFYRPFSAHLNLYNSCGEDNSRKHGFWYKRAGKTWLESNRYRSSGFTIGKKTGRNWQSAPWKPTLHDKDSKHNAAGSKPFSSVHKWRKNWASWHIHRLGYRISRT